MEILLSCSNSQTTKHERALLLSPRHEATEMLWNHRRYVLYTIMVTYTNYFRILRTIDKIQQS